MGVIRRLGTATIYQLVWEYFNILIVNIITGNDHTGAHR